MSQFINTYEVGDRDERHWGFYEVIDVGFLPEEEGGYAYCDKLLGLSPGKSLSVQMHYFRREKWVVTKGEIVVTMGNTIDTLKDYVVKVGETVELPECGIHSAKNRSNSVVEYKERQLGPILDEGDNIRFPSKEDPRTADFDSVARNIENYIKLGFPQQLEGKWSEAYKMFDPEKAEFQAPKNDDACCSCCCSH